MHLLSLMACNGCPPAVVLHHEQGMSRAIQDFQPLLPTTGSRQVITRPSILTLMPNEQDDMFKSASGLYGFNQFQFVKRPSSRKMPLLVDPQDMPVDLILFSFGIDEQHSKHKQTLRFLLSKSNKLREDYLDPSVLPELMELQAISADMHLQYVASADSEFINCYGAKASILHPNGNYYDQEIDPDLFHDLPSTISFESERQLSFISTMENMKDLISVLEEFSLRTDSAQWRSQKVLVPHFRWNDAIDQDHVYPASLKLEATAFAPLKSPEKVKLKPGSKRKNKKTTRERDLYRSNSFHACESLLSLIMDKNRNGKSVMSSLKKSGPELPQLLTQFSATIAGTGLAVIFSVIYKVACGSVPFGSSNLLTSGFGIGLFWISFAVNKLRDTIIYIGKNSSKMGFLEEEMMMKVDESVNDIIFRAAASMVMLMLRFA